ncbi:YfaZ family outer membrane protein [Marinomonas sp. RSW2]|uniref:YfaZ family outer membrane protein n=1 Tax=Marinomonas maritima TaxID=2940935 RepID=A0ABT5WFP4_9GAMM|nr:YfaZ family outer membrane protein [Marinomonas maritima]MDE8603194.1 YfaZ family outer membrane protein [Marinomonas maritima]
MNLTHKTLLLTAGILGSSLVNASTASVALTNETVKGDASFDMGTYSVDAGFSYDKDESVTAGYLGLGIDDSDTNGPLQVGLGVRLYGIYADLKDDGDVSAAIALGGWYRYTIPEANRLSIFGSLYYAPESLSLTNLDHMYVYELRAEYMTMRNARAFLSYGKTRIVYENKIGTRKEVNNGFAIGATVDF